MDNETKLSQEQINMIMKDLSSMSAQGRVDGEELMKKHLDEKQVQQVRNVLADPQKLKSILQSPMAKKIIEAMNRKKE